MKTQYMQVQISCWGEYYTLNKIQCVKDLTNCFGWEIRYCKEFIDGRAKLLTMEEWRIFKSLFRYRFKKDEMLLSFEKIIL